MFFFEQACKFRSHLGSHSSSHSSAKFYFLYYPFTSLLPSLLTSWFGQPPATSCHNMPRLGPLLAGWVSIKWRGLTPHLHHNTIALWGEQRNWSSRGQNQHSEAISALTLLQTFTSSTILSQLCYHLSWLLGLGNLLPDLGTTGPLLAGWVSIKRRGLTPHLHHNTVALCERGEELEQQGSESALRSHLSSHSSAKFYFLCYPFTSLLPSLLTSWFGQPPATSCHDMPRLGPCWQGESL